MRSFYTTFPGIYVMELGKSTHNRLQLKPSDPLNIGEFSFYYFTIF